MPKRSWTDEQLVEAVRASATMREVIRALGLRQASYETLRGHMRRLGIDASHIRAASSEGGRRPRSWTEQDLRRVVAESECYSDVQRALGYAPSGGVHRWLVQHIERLDIPTGHFIGRAWARGRTFPYRPKLPIEELLIEGSSVASGRLRRRLINEGLKQARCEECGLDSWRGALLPLALDHINGDPMDNRLENLRILCPNCHAQTPTWCAGNRKPA